MSISLGKWPAGECWISETRGGVFEHCRNPTNRRICEDHSKRKDVRVLIRYSERHGYGREEVEERDYCPQAREVMRLKAELQVGHGAIGGSR